VPTAQPLKTGDPRRLGAYELTGRLGEGGQGVVYLGTSGEDSYAVKLLHESVGDERVAFLREVELAKHVARFCTAQVLEAGFDDGQPYIVSEYVDGPSLARHVALTGPRSGAALERLAVGTATALAAIHRAGIVHRDFKPQNVLLGVDGPRVIDFGLARVLDAAATVSGRGVGTPAYMAPEQITASAITGAADVFAWGATMCFAANATAPFGQDSVAPVLHRILTAPPVLGRLEGRLREIVEICLDKDARNRPSSRELLLELLGGADGVPAEVLRSPPPHILRVPAPRQATGSGPVADPYAERDTSMERDRSMEHAGQPGVAGQPEALAGPALAEPEATGMPGGYLLPGPALGSDPREGARAGAPAAYRAEARATPGVQWSGEAASGMPGGRSGEEAGQGPGHGRDIGRGHPGSVQGFRDGTDSGQGAGGAPGERVLTVLGTGPVPGDGERTRDTGRAVNRAGVAISAALLVSTAVLVTVVVPGLRQDGPPPAAAGPTVVTIGPAGTEPEPESRDGRDGIATQQERERPEPARSSAAADPPARTAVVVKVPALAGLDRAAATAALKRAGLVVGVVTQVGSSRGIGKVVGSDPGAGRSLAKGSTVALRVSAGLVVPAVTGLQRDAAKKAVTGAGLAVGAVTTSCSARPEGEVLSSRPGSGARVAGGAKVSLVVSRNGTAVPSVVGRTGPVARAELRAAGFAVTRQAQVVADEAQVGTVLAQSVAAGTCAKPGSGVVLTLGVAGQSEPDPTEPTDQPTSEPTPTTE
jgi:beta-lactam-binding protein with PASTA domain/predicted Ser/Thr protein kinase